MRQEYKDQKGQEEEDYGNSFFENLLSKITPEEQKETDRKMLLAATISKAMRAKGLKQNQFAEMLHKSPSEISKWLSGTHTFTIDTLWLISDTLEVELISLNEKHKTNSEGIEGLTEELKTKNELINSLRDEIREKDLQIKKIKRENAIARERRVVSYVSGNNYELGNFALLYSC